MWMCMYEVTSFHATIMYHPHQRLSLKKNLLKCNNMLYHDLLYNKSHMKFL